MRGERKISSKKLFNSVSDRFITNIRFITSIVDELVIGGNLTINNCLFPEGEWFLHIKKPFQVYQECLRQIDQTWTGEKKQIGRMEIQRMYLDKGVQNQNEDFIFYAENKYIPAEVDETVKSVFLLIRVNVIQFEKSRIKWSSARRASIYTCGLGKVGMFGIGDAVRLPEI